MKVNFNNLRQQACFAYDKLCGKLNDGILKEDQHTWVDGYGWLSKGDVVVRADEIQEHLDDLRMLIGSIAMVYQEGDKDFADVYPKDKSMAEFNPEPEEAGKQTT